MATLKAGSAGGDGPAVSPWDAAGKTASAATILIVDDEPGNRKLLEAMLRRENYVTVTAADGEEALAAIARHAPDLILLDIKLPGIDGYQVARALKGDPGTANIPIIVVTILVDRDARMTALKAGVEELVTKPVDPNELLLRVRNLLRLKAYGDLLHNYGMNLEQKVEARTAELRASEQRLRTIIATEPECVKVVTEDMVLMDMNPAGLAMLEAGSLAEVQAQPLVDFIVPEHRPAFADLHARVMRGESGIMEFQIVGLKGGQRWLETHAAPLIGRDGKVQILLGISRDITVRKAAEAKIIRLNRVYAVLSGINSAIVRIRERDVLFRETCRIAVSEGGYALARVVEVDANGKARIATSTESDSRLIQSIVDDYNRDPEHSKSMLRLALHDRQPLYSNDVAGDPRIPNRAALTKGGNYALAMLPIHAGNRFVGTLILRAQAADAFDKEEKHLLLELTGNLSLALEHIEQEERLGILAAGQERDQEELRRFSVAMDATADAIYLVDRSSMRFVHVNDAACRMQSRTREEMFALGPNGVLGITRAELESTYDALIASGVEAEPVEMQRPRKGSSHAWVELRRNAQRTANGWTIVTLVRDVTERKHAQQSIMQEKDFVNALLDGLPGLFYLIDDRGRFIRWNKEFELVSGYSSDEISRLNPTDLFAGTDKDLIAEKIRQVFQGSEVVVEADYVAKHGTRTPYIFTGRRVQFDQKPHLIGMGIDITERRKADKRIRHLNRVYAVLSGINTLIVRVSDRDELFRESCRIAVEHGGFRMAWVGIVDRTRMELLPVASAGTTQDHHQLVNQRFSLLELAPRGNTMGARSIREKTAIFSNDVQNDPRVVFKDEHAARGSRSMVILPLQVHGEVAGLLTLYAEEAGFFDDEEIKLLSELAGDIAFAVDHIERAGKLARVTRVNAMLSGINGAIVRIRGRQELFEEACRIAHETGGMSFAWAGVADASGTRLQLVAFGGRDGGFLQTIRDRLALRDAAPEAQALSTRALREGRVVVVNDVAADPVINRRKAFADRGIKAVAVFPLAVAGRVVGTFALHSEQAGFFDEDEMRLLHEVAANIAFALEHIEKEDKVRRLTRVYAVLSGINALIARASDRDELFRDACLIAVEQAQFKRAWIGVVDRSAMKIEPVASAGSKPEYLAFIKDSFSLVEDPAVDLTLTARAVLERKALFSNDTQNDPAIKFKKEHLETGTRSVASIPLLIADESVGVLCLYTEEAGFFDAEEIALLVELASNIAFAVDHIDKAGKLDRTTRVNAMLSGINGAIVRIRDRQALFEEACRIAVGIGAMPFAWIGVTDASGKQLQLVASAGRDDGFLQTIRDRLALRDAAPEAQALSTRALREGRAVVVNDVAADPVISRRKGIADRGIKAVAIFPLFIAGRVVGTFALYAEQAGFFDEDEMRLLNEVASNIAFALEHIEKEEKVRRLTRVYAVLSGINALIVRATDRDELFKESCRIAVEVGQFSKAWLGTIDPVSKQFRIVAAHGGDPLFLRSLEEELAAKVREGRGLVVRTIETGQPVIVNDAASEPEVLFKDVVTASGVRSMAILPLTVSGEVVAVFVLNADVVDYFDDEEMKLLVELAGDIGFALDHIGKEAKLDYLAYYDALTGLANRTLFLERVALHMRSAVAGGHKLALFFLDLERFRNINDSLGRPAGDALLKQVAEWLALYVGDQNLLARLGGDHFGIVQPEVAQEGDVARLLEKRMRAFVDHPFRLNDTEIRLATKVGVAVFPNDGTDAETLLRNAETALKKAKTGGERWLFYQQKMTDQRAGKLTLESQLRRALDNEEFVLHYQPKVSLESGKLTSAEALIRWNDPQSGLVPPGKFIPILEETGLIYDVGRWALRKAISEYLRWRAAGLPAVRIAVNVSPLQLRNRGFSTEIQQVVGIDPLAPAGLELEITESVIMEDVKSSIASLQAIRALGVTIAIDDFGTGFSSLSHLARLPVDALKIDRSFVMEMTSDAKGLSLIQTVIGLAHSLKLKVVAEGVETEEQSRLLRLLRCDEMQGFLFSKPVPAEDFEAKFLTEGHHVRKL